MRKKQFQIRSFASILVAVTFLFLTITGLVLYVVPSGRVANWIEWNLLLMDKETWARVHTVLGFLFLIGGPIHLAFNWKPFRNYLATRWSAHLRPRRELLAACLLAILVTVGAIADWPPVSYVTDLSGLAKDSWRSDGAPALPPGKPEELTLSDLAARIGVEPDKARTALTDAGIQLGQADATLTTIAATNGVSPQTLFELASRVSGANVSEAIETAVAPHAGGSGLGQKTVAEIAAADGIPLDTAVARLVAAGIDAGGGDRLRDMADGANFSPSELADIIRGGTGN